MTKEKKSKLDEDNEVQSSKTAEIAEEINDAEVYFTEDTSKIQIAVANPDGALAGLFDWVRCILFAIAIVIICLTFAFRLVDVEGSSMYDTLYTGDKVIVTNFMYTPKNNDIVVISHGAEYSKPIIKRVIATEGQRIQLDYENERIIVDGIVLDEPYLYESTFSGNIGNNEIPEIVPEGKIFVMGDNRKV